MHACIKIHLLCLMFNVVVNLKGIFHQRLNQGQSSWKGCTDLTCTKHLGHLLNNYNCTSQPTSENLCVGASVLTTAHPSLHLRTYV